MTKLNKTHSVSNDASLVKKRNFNAVSFFSKIIINTLKNGGVFKFLLMSKEAKFFFFIINNFIPIVENNGLLFYGLFKIPYSRGKTLMTKEPEMISFIEDHVNEGEVYYDIGANIGVFSLYAAKNKMANVISFEPESSNYFILNKNILLNKLSERVVAYCIAINDVNEISKINLKDAITPGKSGNTFKDKINQDHERFKPMFEQGSFGMSLDDFVFVYGNKCPDHVKIDVDGNEHHVINGMNRIMQDGSLKTIAIEINTMLTESNHLIKIIEQKGYERVFGYRNEAYEKIGVINYFFKKTILS